MVSRLGYYIQALELSGKEIAHIAHVDPSLVSKWKNGQRLLRKESNEANLLSQYLLDQDINKEESFFTQCFIQNKELLEIYKNGSNKKKAWLILQLICEDGEIPFLKPKSTNKHLLANTDKTDTQIAKESYEMICNYLEELTLRNIEKLTFHLTVSHKWLNDFLADGTICDYLLNFSKQGILELSIGLINEDNLRVTTSNYTYWFKSFLPFYIHKFFKLSIAKASPQGNSWYMIADGIGTLKGLSLTDQKFPNGYTHYLSENSLVKFHQKYISNMNQSYQQLGKRYTRHHLKDVLNLVQNSGIQRDTSYFISTQLFFTSMSISLLTEIMNDNKFSESLKTMTLDIYDRLNKNFSQNVTMFDNRHVYCYESLEALALNNQFLYHHLTLITNKPVYIKKTHFIRHIQDTIQRLELHPKHQISLVREKVFYKMTTVQHMWLKDSNILMMWHPEALDETVIIEQNPIIWHFIKDINMIWQAESNGYDNNESTIRQLNKLIKIAQVNQQVN